MEKQRSMGAQYTVTVFWLVCEHLLFDSTIVAEPLRPARTATANGGIQLVGRRLGIWRTGQPTPKCGTRGRRKSRLDYTAGQENTDSSTSGDNHGGMKWLRGLQSHQRGLISLMTSLRGPTSWEKKRLEKEQNQQSIKKKKKKLRLK